VDTGPGRNRIDVQRARPILAAFVANDPHHGLFAPRKPRRKMRR
jgi:hypothetical protein